MPKVQKIEDGRHAAQPLRVSFRKGRGKRCGRLLVRCGCCEERLELYPDTPILPPESDAHATTIEINGVIATVDQWRQIFGPLLGLKNP